MSDFRHPAFFYRTPEEYLAGATAFVHAGLSAGQPVAVAVPGPRLEEIRAGLGSAAGSVKMIDMREAGRNPGRILPGVLSAFADAHPHATPHIIGEPIWPGRTETEYPACAQHEALINLAFAGRSIAIMCPYDASRLGRRALADAAVSHPVLWDADGERKSDRFAPERLVADYNTPLPEPVGTVRVLPFDEAALPLVREFTVAETLRAGLGRDRAGDAELVVNELAANSVHHGGGSGVVRIWRHYGQVVCEVSDQGRMTDPLVGRRPAGDSVRGGRGVLMVNLIADLVRTHTGPAGTTTRAYFRRV
ncbi:anti-sigma factor RsbA family regulatory protein [Actinocorallia longicatena]